MNFIIKLVVYPFDVMVSIDEDDEILEAALKRKGITYDNILNMPVGSLGRCAMLNGGQTVIRLKTQCQPHLMCSVIAHEIFHAVTFIMYRIGVKLEIEVSDEAYAYLIGHLTSEIHKRLSRTPQHYRV